MAKKYEAFPELLTPRIITMKTQNQDMNRPTTNCQFGAPMPSSIIDQYAVEMLAVGSHILVSKWQIRLNSTNITKIQSKMICTVAAVMVGICASVYIESLCVAPNRLLTVGSPLKTASPTKSVKYKQ
uniref:Uncharacterized protein n=1 Tax=Glossina austeni TaxID=7395 RepID=A0A1A9VQ64_GLOAU